MKRKGLSTEDYSTAEKAKLAAPVPYSNLDTASRHTLRDELDTGFATVPRWATGAQTALATGTMRFTFFTAPETASRSNVTIVAGSTAAGATPTLVRFGVYSVAGNGDLTLIGSTVSDTALFVTPSIAYTKAFSSAVSFVAGNRYAWAPLIVTAAAAPSVFASANIGAAEMAIAPRLTAQLGSQTDLPSTVASGSLSTSGFGLIYARFS